MAKKNKIEGNISIEQKDFIKLVKQGREDPVFFSENLLGVLLHDGQKLWLWITTKTQTDKARELYNRLMTNRQIEFDDLLKKVDFTKNILVPSNRWGKTLVTSGVKHIWINYYKIGVSGDPDQVADLRCGSLNISPHSNQCQAGFDYILDILASKFFYIIGGKSFRNKCLIENFYVNHNIQKRHIMFKNNTFYRTVPTGEDQASSLAGMRFLYISYDEAAQSLHLKGELPAKIMSRLIDFGGPLDLVSTPEVDKPSHQYFFHIAKLGLKGDDGWFTLVGKISDNIFLNQIEVSRISENIKSTDPAKYRQVIFGEFVTTGKKMFDAITVERIWDETSPRIPEHEHKYLLVADWGFSDTGDPTVFYVIDYTDAPRYRVAFRESIHGGSPFAVLARAKILQREWNGAKFLHDANAMGGVMIKKMLREMNMLDMIDFTSMGGQKQDMLFCIILVLSEGRKTEQAEDGKIKELNPNFGRLRSYYIPDLEEQMGNYQFNPDKGVTDKKLEQDDVMALGMGLWWLERKHMQNPVKMMHFNPLASTIDKVFPEKEAQLMGIKYITIPEKRIL